MRKLLVVLAMAVVLCWSAGARAGIVNNTTPASGTPEDSVSFTFTMLDTLGNSVARASGDSLWVFSFYPGGALAGADSCRLLTDAKIHYRQTQMGTKLTATYQYANAVGNLDGTGESGTYGVLLRAYDSSLALTTERWCEFQLVTQGNFAAVLDSGAYGSTAGDSITVDKSNLADLNIRVASDDTLAVVTKVTDSVFADKSSLGDLNIRVASDDTLAVVTKVVDSVFADKSSLGDLNIRVASDDTLAVVTTVGSVTGKVTLADSSANDIAMLGNAHPTDSANTKNMSDSLLLAITDVNKANFKATGFSTFDPATDPVFFETSPPDSVLWHMSGDLLLVGVVHTDDTASSGTKFLGKAIWPAALPQDENAFQHLTVYFPRISSDPGTARRVSAYKVFTASDSAMFYLSPSLALTPSANDTFYVYGQLLSVYVGAMATAVVNADAVAANAIGSSELATTAADEIAYAFMHMTNDTTGARWATASDTSVAYILAQILTAAGTGGGAADFTAAEADSIVAQLQEAIDSIRAQVWASTAAGSGSGPLTDTVWAIDTSGTDTAIPGVTIVVRNASGSRLALITTNGTGYEVAELPQSTAVTMTGFMAGYTWNSKTITTESGTTDTDTLFGYNIDITSPTAANLKRIYDDIYTFMGDSIQGATAVVELLVPDSTIVPYDTSTGISLGKNPPPGIAYTAASGRFTIDVIPNDYIRPAGTRYRVTVYAQRREFYSVIINATGTTTKKVREMQ